MEIQVQENIIDVSIAGKQFMIDADAIVIHEAIDEFTNKYRGKREISESFLQDCKQVMDVILGKGAYDSLFTGKDLKPYYVLLQLIETIEEKTNTHLFTNSMKKREQEAKEELQNLQEIMQGFQKFSEQMEYVENKYGANSYVANKKKTSNKRRSK